MKTLSRALVNLRWLPAYFGQLLTRRQVKNAHVVITVADHFEPSFLHGRGYADPAEQQKRLDRWCGEFPRVVNKWRDSTGRPWRHTYFYPAEQYDAGLVSQLAQFCRAGWGEIEVHLHHGVERPDTTDNLRQTLTGFVDKLVGHGCLSRWEGVGRPGFAFVHGNWALANSAGGMYCGVDDEMQVLCETGCYADFTLPSAPDRSQVAKINSLYECGAPLRQRTPHRKGKNLTRGVKPQTFPIIIQGPLLLNFSRSRGRRFLPRIENSVLSKSNPPTLERFQLWTDAAISVEGTADWIFVKLHSHGMDPIDMEMLLGRPLGSFLEQLTSMTASKSLLHFVTAREMMA